MPNDRNCCAVRLGHRVTPGPAGLNCTLPVAESRPYYQPREVPISDLRFAGKKELMRLRCQRQHSGGARGARRIAADKTRELCGTNRNLAAVARARRLSRVFNVAFVWTFGRRATRSKIEPLRMSKRALTQRLMRVSSFGRRTSAAMAPSSAMTMASSVGRSCAGTVEPSHSKKPALPAERRSRTEICSSAMIVQR
jgi:hypothetical protein